MTKTINDEYFRKPSIDEIQGLLKDMNVPHLNIPITFLRNNTELNSKEKMCYMMLRTFALDSTSCFPSLKTLMGCLGWSKPTVTNTIASLEEKKYLVKLEQYQEGSERQMNNLYVLAKIDENTGLKSENSLTPALKAKELCGGRGVVTK